MFRQYSMISKTVSVNVNRRDTLNGDRLWNPQICSTAVCDASRARIQSYWIPFHWEMVSDVRTIEGYELLTVTYRKLGIVYASRLTVKIFEWVKRCDSIILAVQTKVNKLKNIIITLLDPRIIRIRRPLSEMDPRISADPTNSCGTGSAGGPIRDPHISGMQCICHAAV